MSDDSSPVLAPLAVVSETPAVTVPVTSAPLDAASTADTAPLDTSATPEAPRDDKGRFSKRTDQLNSQISTLTSAKHQLHREIEALTRKADQLRTTTLTPPDPSDYDATQRHQMRSALRDERLAETSHDVHELQTRAHEVRLATFEAKIQAAAETVPELNQAVQQFFKLPVSEVAAEMIAESDHAPAIVHFLARNPAEAHRIHALPAYRQAAEIARLEARVSSVSPRRVSQAPAPVTTVSGGSGANGVDLGSLSMQDYYTARMKQMGAT